MCEGSPVGTDEGENGIDKPELKADAVASPVFAAEALDVGVVFNDNVACAENVAIPDCVVISEACAVNETEDVDEDEPEREDIKLSIAVRLKAVL